MSGLDRTIPHLLQKKSCSRKKKKERAFTYQHLPNIFIIFKTLFISLELDKISMISFFLTNPILQHEKAKTKRLWEKTKTGDFFILKSLIDKNLSYLVKCRDIILAFHTYHRKIQAKRTNPFHTTGVFLHLLKTSKNNWFSDFFRGCRTKSVAEMG